MSIRIEERDKNHPDVGKVFKPSNPLYASSLWLSFYTDFPLNIYIIYNGNDPVGGFYLHQTKKFGLKIITNPMFCPTNGFILHDSKKTGYLKYDFLKEVHDAVSSFMTFELNPHLLFTSFPVWITNMQSYHWAGMSCRPYYTYVLDLNLGEDEILKRASNKVRKALSQSEKDFYFTSSTSKEILLDILEKTYRRNGKNYPSDIPRKMMFSTDEANSFYFVAHRKNDGKAVAFAHCIHDNQTAYQLFNGYDNALPSGQSVKACFLLCIRESLRRGLKYFDFEGSMIPSVEKGIREFGGDPVPYYSVSYCKKILKPFASLKFPDKF
jgi:hypothetical protein